MIMSAQLIADSYVSLAAVIGLLILRSNLEPTGKPNWINNRYRFVILVLVWMLVSRVLYWLSGWEFFSLVNFVSASLIPLSMLLLCEGLMRRHAHKFFKAWTVLGALALILLVPFEAILPTATLAKTLAVFQLGSFLGIGGWVVFRERNELSIQENTIIDRLAWSLVFIIAFAATDFRLGYFELPVRMSGVAILTLCWLSLSLNRIREDHMRTISSLVLFFVGSAIAALTVAMIAGLDTVQTVQVGVIILCSGLVLQVYGEARSLDEEDQLNSILRYIAEFDGNNSVQFLRGLQNHPVVSGALILNEPDLDDFDDGLLQYLKQRRTISIHSVSDPLSADLREQFTWLFEKYSATHAVHISDDPKRLLVVNMPSVTNETSKELELLLVQRFASLMAKMEAA